MGPVNVDCVRRASSRCIRVGRGAMSLCLVGGNGPVLTSKSNCRKGGSVCTMFHSHSPHLCRAIVPPCGMGSKGNSCPA